MLSWILESTVLISLKLDADSFPQVLKLRSPLKLFWSMSHFEIDISGSHNSFAFQIGPQISLENTKCMRCENNVARSSLSKAKFICYELTLLWFHRRTLQEAFNITLILSSVRKSCCHKFFLEYLCNIRPPKFPFCPK